MAGRRILAAFALASLVKTNDYVLARNRVNSIGTVVNSFQDTAKEVAEEGDAERAFWGYFT